MMHTILLLFVHIDSVSGTTRAAGHTKIATSDAPVSLHIIEFTHESLDGSLSLRHYVKGIMVKRLDDRL